MKHKQSFVLQTKKLERIESFFCEMLFLFLVFNLSQSHTQVLFLDTHSSSHLPYYLPCMQLNCVHNQM